MNYKIAVSITLCWTIILVNGDCVPRAIQSLALSINGILTWTVSPEESCDITHYQITISRTGFDTYNIDVDGTAADVTFLPFCVSWIFSVRAVTADSSSVPHLLIARLPMPPETTIALSYLNITEVDGIPRLVWDVENETLRRCADVYRITIYDTDNGDLSDQYVSNTYLNLESFSPCVLYEFEVRAITNQSPSEEGPVKTIEFDYPPTRNIVNITSTIVLELSPPKLQYVSLGATGINTTWVLDSIIQNRCQIRTLYVDGGNYFNISFPISDGITRDPVSVNLQSLQPNSMYLLRVSVENSGGISRPAVVGIQTLDLQPQTD